MRLAFGGPGARGTVPSSAQVASVVWGTYERTTGSLPVSLAMHSAWQHVALAPAPQLSSSVKRVSSEHPFTRISVRASSARVARVERIHTPMGNPTCFKNQPGVVEIISGAAPAPYCTSARVRSAPNAGNGSRLSLREESRPRTSRPASNSSRHVRARKSWLRRGQYSVCTLTLLWLHQRECGSGGGCTRGNRCTSGLLVDVSTMG